MRDGNEIRVALINKDLRQDADVSVTAGGKVRHVRPMVLSAPSATATSGMNLDRDSREGIKPEANGSVRVHVPAASATLVWLVL